MRGVVLSPSNASASYFIEARVVCFISVMNISNWDEQTIEEILREAEHNDDNSLRRIVTATGDVQTPLDGSNVYSVSRSGIFCTALQRFRCVAIILYPIVRLHLMREVQTIAINDPGVSQSVTKAGCAKTAEQIDVLFELETRGKQETLYHGEEGVGLMRPLPKYFGHLFCNAHMLRKFPLAIW